MSAVNHRAYETLRTETLSATVPWVGSDTFAHVASWAIWADQTPADTGWSRDLRPLTWDFLAGRLHNDVVFVALNKGTNPADLSIADWSNFHTGHADYKLARAVDQPGVREVLGGAYITDFFKGLPTPTSAALERYLDIQDEGTRGRTVDAMVALLERELAILGCEDPLLVGIGRDAQHWLRQRMGHYRLAEITHYAHAIGAEEYARELAEVAELVHPPEA